MDFCEAALSCTEHCRYYLVLFYMLLRASLPLNVRHEDVGRFALDGNRTGGLHFMQLQGPQAETETVGSSSAVTLPPNAPEACTICT